MTKAEREALRIETEKLVDLDLPIPQAVKDFYELRVRPSIGKGYEFAEYIEEHNGRLLQRVFCFQVYGLYGKEASVREVTRRYEGGGLVFSNITGGYMYHYRADDTYNGNDMHESGWVPKWARVNCKWKPDFSYPYLCLNTEEWLKKYPYCEWEKYHSSHGSLCFWQYLVRYRKESKIELLVKMGYPNFVTFYNELNIKARRFEEIFGLSPKQSFAKEFLKKGSINELRILRKYKWITSEEELKAYLELEEYRKNHYCEKLTEEELKYLVKKVKGHISLYYDYIDAAKKLGYPLGESKFRYPKDLVLAHDEAVTKLLIIRNKEKEGQIKKVAKECTPLKYEKDGLILFPPTTYEEFITESKLNENCVRMKVDSVCRGDYAIMFIRKSDDPNKPFCTLGLSKVKSKRFNRITEVRAYHNSLPDREVLDFVMEWKAKNNLGGWSA